MGFLRRGGPRAPKGERLLAWGQLEGDAGQALATDRALHLPESALPAGFPARIRWDQIVRASWDDPVVEMQVNVDRPRTLTLVFADAGSVPEAIRERVTSSIETETHLRLVREDGEVGGASVSARRNRDSGELAWSVVFDRGLDPREPGWRAAADSALAELRANLGL